MAEVDINRLAPRIKRKIKIDPVSKCWIWSACISEGGYGRISWKSRQRQAHRVVYEILVGPIPDGLEIDHLCRVRACVNPAHLEPVTGEVNILRGMWIPVVNSRLTHCRRGHEFTEENIYSPRGERVCRECSRMRVREYRKRLKEEKHDRYNTR